jgi:Fe-S-cluster-containing hydrogenase component 2
MLRAARQFPRPADYLQSNYQAAVDAELCTECETCRSRCPMDALVSANGATVVDQGRCIGCGLCVSTCPSGAARLRPREHLTVPPRGLPALYGRILFERFGAVGAAKRIGRALLGRQI